MARGRKKSKSMKLNLRYELYGILILALSVITLAKGGTVGRSLTYMSRFLIGVADWAIPLIAIYVGLYAMMKREWPKIRTARKTGVLFVLLGYVVINHMSMFQTLDPSNEYRDATYILSQTWQSMKDGLKPAAETGLILQKDIGGGMIGALIYSVLYFLFGDLGARMLVWAWFVIGFVLVTGISVVSVVSRLRGQASHVHDGFKHRLIAIFSRKQAASARSASPKKSTYIPMDDDEFDEEDEFGPPVKKKAKKPPVFFQLLQHASNREKDMDSSVHEDDEELSHEVLIGAKATASSYTEAEADAADHDDKALIAGTAEDSTIPYIRDFMDHHEDNVLDQQIVEEAPPWEADPASAEAEPDAPVKPPALPYLMPSLNLLGKPAGNGKGSESTDFKANARKLEATLESFGVRAKVLEVVRGPAVTRYEIQPDVGVKVSRIVSLTDDIALALAAKDIRMEAPIPGKSAIGIEVPNSEVSVVTLREVMETSAFQDSTSRLTITLGRDISGQPIVGNLAKMPHLLVAGATGSGKSVCINGIITSILYKAKPDEVKLMMIDPKMVELNVYNGIPHLLAPVVTDPRRASLALKKIVVEMEKRYELFSKSGTRNIEGYNAMITDPNNPNQGEPLPFIVVIVDELADLMMVAAGDVEDAICRLAQMARAAGIHLIIATQRPSVDVITGVIKANIPSRIAFGVSSQVDSRTILDMVGAEKLLGRGDMLFLPVGASKPIRVQGAFLSDQEVESVVTFVRTQGQADYKEDMVPQVEEQDSTETEFEDELYDQAVQIVVEAKQASVSLLQRRMRVGYTRAARLIDSMEAKGVVGPYEGSKPREVLISPEQFYQQNRISS